MGESGLFAFYTIVGAQRQALTASLGNRLPALQAYRRGVKLVGATAHYVTAELDGGPIIAQDVIGTAFRRSRPKGSNLQEMVLARAVRLHLENRVLPYGSKTAVFDQRALSSLRESSVSPANRERLTLRSARFSNVC